MKKLRELLDKRNRLIAQMRAMMTTAEGESRGLTAEEQTNYDKIFAEADGIRQTIDNEQRLAALEAQGGEGNERREGNGEERQLREVRAIDAAEHRYRVVAGEIRDESDRRTLEYRATREYNDAFRNFLATGERRALDAGSGAGGGYTIAPVQFVQDLIKKVDDLVFIRARATVRTVTNAAGLGAVSLENDPADADWVAELTTGSEDTTMSFGQRELKPYPSAKLAKVSNKLMRASGINVEGLLLQRLAYKFGITEEKAFLTGSGANQPLGIFTASTDGIDTGRDVATGNTSTSIGFDGLISAKFSLKAPYLTNAVWGFHRDGVAQISKLKDTTNQYLWQPSTQLGQPDRILGLPVFMSEFIPNTFTTGLYVGFIGDISNYWIADALDMQVQRLVELYARTNQTGFIARRETDGQPVLAEAFARVKLA